MLQQRAAPDAETMSNAERGIPLVMMIPHRRQNALVIVRLLIFLLVLEVPIPAFPQNAPALPPPLAARMVIL